MVRSLRRRSGSTVPPARLLPRPRDCPRSRSSEKQARGWDAGCSPRAGARSLALPPCAPTPGIRNTDVGMSSRSRPRCSGSVAPMTAPMPDSPLSPARRPARSATSAASLSWQHVGTGQVEDVRTPGKALFDAGVDIVRGRIRCLGERAPIGEGGRGSGQRQICSDCDQFGRQAGEALGMGHRQKTGELHEFLAVNRRDEGRRDGWHRSLWRLEGRAGLDQHGPGALLDTSRDPVFTPRGRGPGEVGAVARTVDNPVHRGA